MKPECKKIQDTLATEGPGAFRNDPDAQRHLEECDSCYAVLEALSSIEEGFADLPMVDAPDEVVDTLLNRPELQTPPGASRSGVFRFVSARSFRVPRSLAWSGAMAALLLVTVAVGMFLRHPVEKGQAIEVAREFVPDAADPDERTIIVRKYVPPPPQPAENLSPAKEESKLTADEIVLLESLGYVGDDRVGAKDDVRENEEGKTVPTQTIGGNRVANLESTTVETRFSDEYIQDLPVPGRFYQNVAGEEKPELQERVDLDYKAAVSGISNVDPILEKGQGGYAENEPMTESESSRDKNRQTERLIGTPDAPPPTAPLIAGHGSVTNPAVIPETRVEPEYPELARVARVVGKVILQAVVLADGSVGTVEVLSCNRPRMGFEESAVNAVKQWRYEPAFLNGKPVDVYMTVVVEFGLDHSDKDPESSDQSAAPATDHRIHLARQFLDERAETGNLTFRPATGYWSNTYVPGDASTRLLQARLAGWDLSTLRSWVPATPRLHQAALQIGQPFDSPDTSALAVYLHADRVGAAGETRALIQVGLKGTPRHGGRRPAINLGIVLDLRDEVTAEVARNVRSLLDAFNRARQPGDRMRVFVAGSAGGLVVPAESFRHGFLKVTLDRLLDRPDENAPVMPLADTLSSAMEAVAGDDDPNATLGSSAVLLVTAQPLGPATRTLAEMAHSGAVAGIPTSVVGVGEGVELAELDRLALAGQGHRRLLDAPSEASALVDRELAAVGRAIARAVRLRIRLAPGVRLIDVLGSERLDETRAQRVRDAEKSIDLRLSRNLGIQADRGEDEAGIQIVIPSFYADDSHVILLDVVTPGAGPLADVTVRYKDLVHLRNGVGRASLRLDGTPGSAGPLETNVVKNLLSFRLSETLNAAAAALGAGDVQTAVRTLDDFRSMIDGLRRELPELANDHEIAQDTTMLNEYVTLLANGFEDRGALTDSLRYAARCKLLRQPRHLQETQS